MGKQTNIRTAIVGQNLTQVKLRVIVLLVPRVEFLAHILHHAVRAIVAFGRQMGQDALVVFFAVPEIREELLSLNPINLEPKCFRETGEFDWDEIVSEDE